MKKYITTFIMTAIIAISIPAMATSSIAQTRGGRDREYSNRGYVYDDYGYGNNYNYGQPTTYDRHRKAINISVATGAGAIIGALFGGKKGALIGAGAGAATGIIITKAQRPRNYYRY